MGFIRLMVAVIFIMLFGYCDHKNVSLFLECLRTLKRNKKMSPFLYRSCITYKLRLPHGKGLALPS